MEEIEMEEIEKIEDVKIDIKKNPLLNREEGIEYLRRLARLLPDSQLKDDLNLDVKFLENLKYSTIIVPISPFNGFPTIGTIIGDSNSIKTKLGGELRTIEGLESILSGKIKKEDVKMAFSKSKLPSDTQYEESLLTVKDKFLSLEFRFWFKDNDGFKEDTLFVSDLTKNQYKFNTVTNTLTNSNPNNTDDNNKNESNYTEVLTTLSDNLTILGDLFKENLTIPFLDYTYSNGLETTLETVNGVSKYVATIIDYLKLVREDKIEYISQDLVETLITARERLSKENSTFYRLTQEDSFMEFIINYEF